MQSLFPASTMVVERIDFASDMSLLWPAEALGMDQAATKRRSDYVTGRLCARQALEKLGLHAVPILSGEKGEPLWPLGIVGSITHTDRYVAAAISRASNCVAIGIDAEPDEPLPSGVLERIAILPEREMLNSPSIRVNAADRLLFCAKEAIYKAWYPLTHNWLGFEDVCLDPILPDGTFSAEILVPGPLKRIDGKYKAYNGILKAVVHVGPSHSIWASKDEPSVV